MKTSTTQKQNGTKKINRISVVDQVCESLKHDISSHRWIAGDKIPSEGELADAFGVNRLSVRMALQKLNTLGIIETRVGEGSFVTDFSLKPMLMEVAPFYEGDKKYRDIQHMRLLLETESARIAIREATDENKSALQMAYRNYEQKANQFLKNPNDQELFDELIDADFDFHYCIVSISNNCLFKDIYYMTRILIKEHIINQSKKHNYLVQEDTLNMDFHYRLCSAIVNSDKNVDPGHLLQKIFD